jgi:(p)ppGpp synthase/HD superfamily hydrolase
MRAVRVLVDDIQSCYAALGVIHTAWNYIATVFADEKIGITATSTRTDDEDLMVYMQVTADIPGIEILSKLLSKISQLQNVQEARRLR